MEISAAPRGSYRWKMDQTENAVCGYSVVAHLRLLQKEYEAQGLHGKAMQPYGCAADEIEQLRARAAELEKALKPLADVLINFRDDEIDPHAMIHVVVTHDDEGCDLIGREVLEARRALDGPDKGGEDELPAS